MLQTAQIQLHFGFKATKEEMFDVMKLFLGVCLRARVHLSSGGFRGIHSCCLLEVFLIVCSVGSEVSLHDAISLSRNP